MQVTESEPNERADEINPDQPDDPIMHVLVILRKVAVAEKQ